MVIRRAGVIIASVAALLSACGGDGESSGESDEKQVRDVVHQWVDEDDCSVTSDRFAAEGYSSAEEGRQACEEQAQADPGLRTGEYRLASVKVAGETATARLVLDGGGERTYTVTKDGDDWRIDDFSESFRGKVGDSFVYRDAYEQDGRPVTVKLRVALVGVEENVTTEPYSTIGIEKKNHRWIRAKFRLKSLGRDPFTQSTSDFYATDQAGHRYESNGFVFEPSLGNGGVNLAAGDSVVGFLGYQLPDGSSLKDIRLVPVGGAGEPYVWRTR